jgi:hypothetical protein
MRWICLLLFALCLQSVYLHSLPKSLRLEDNSIYFKKGVYKEFFNNKLERFREIQAEYPGIVFEFTLYQLESEARDLSIKRHKTLIRSFQQSGLDMNRIVFDSKTVYVKSFQDHQLSPETGVLDSIGAVLEGKVLSLH